MTLQAKRLSGFETEIDEVTPEDALAHLAHGAVLLDIREPTLRSSRAVPLVR
jgi:hypothetical protein